MKDLATIQHHPGIEEIVDVLCKKTQNTDRSFFRMMVCFFLGKMASSMRATIETKDRGSVPVNIYALSLAVSGSGKGHSVGILEESFIRGFRDRFMNDTFPVVAEQRLNEIANERLLRKTDSDFDTELEKVKGEFNRLGALAFTFDSGTAPAVKQMRQKLLMANAGSINLQIDEIGSNLVGATEVLNVFLELYDQGLVKQKLTKNTTESLRSEELEGKTPTNMLLFGTPSKLLDGGKTEDEFYSMLETGYARRCIFAYGHRIRAGESLTPAQIYAQLTDTSNEALVDKWATHFTLLADPAKFGWKIYLPDEVGIELLEYRIDCERLADSLPEHEEIKKAEISHRYFKTLKLAGALAFIDESAELTMDHLYYAIKLVEESGTSFERIFSREKNYVKLAKYLATAGSELTHADLNESLPFYKGSQSARNEMMNLAMAWGYKNHIIVKKTFEQGIDFFRGETLKETSLEAVTLSYSDHVAYRYRSERVPFDRMHELTQAPGMHWLNHALARGELGEGHRAGENVIKGFDMVVIDVDKGIQAAQVRELLKDYTFLMYTTKRSTDEANRFRIVMPINYRLELDGEEFREFMSNVFSWLPFEVDDVTGQRERKWETFPGQHWYNEGELLDALQFIPKTSRNEEYKASVLKLENLDNAERWFAQRMVNGNRNNQMLRFAMMLVDTGRLSYQDIERRVIEFNAKLDNKLPDDELRQTVLITVARKLAAAQTP
ncbi:hypothetical protein [Dyella sp. ASV21]|uniref:hypothetical protein n=1 Tax=Dyella sp. ASV21 TaxID=2795114 RepID=UPI0018ECD16C|nr:hypothetical protein [Dyella sp. ASV21]